MKKFENMVITIGVVAYNESAVIKDLLKDIYKQTYPHELTEVLLIDSSSTDDTRNIMLNFEQKYKNEFKNIMVLDNFKKSQPCGWNVALKNYNGDAIIRVDAHARIPQDFIFNNVKHLMNNECVCGGYRPNIIDEETLWKKMLLSAESSMFGSSIADYRRQCTDRCVKSVFHGAYRREVFDTVGQFNEFLTRTEDNDIHSRIREAGFDIHFHSDIVSYQHTRNSLKKMLKQKYLNGYWIGLTIGINPKCISLYHLIPFAFVIAILFTSIFYTLGFPLLGNIMWIAYWLLNLAMSAMAIKNDKGNYTYLLIPLVFLSLHISYGVGTLVGVVKLPFLLHKINSCKILQTNDEGKDE